MSIIIKPFTFSAGAVITASQHNSDFDTIYSDHNGNIDNSNIVSAAGIVASKLDLTSPGGVGTTVAAAGKFTTLEATSTLKLGTTHQGDILYDNGTSLIRLTPGTSGQFLKTLGASANPAWTTLPTNIQLFTSSGTFTAPAGITKVYVTMVGGGGGGGGNASTANGGGGGGAGAAVINYPMTVVPASGYTVTINAGGAGGSSGGGAAGAGGTTVFDTITVLGGSAGITGGSGGTGGAGAAAGTLNGSGQTGGGALGNVAFLAGGTGGTKTGNVGGGGGGSVFGTGATGGADGVVGNNAVANSGAGGSGGGANNGVAGGNGAAGIVIVMY